MANLLLFANSMESMATHFVIFLSTLGVASGLNARSFSSRPYEPSEVYEVCNNLVTDIDHETNDEINTYIPRRSSKF